MKTLKDALQETGISYYTLVKYKGLGLIPKSQRVWRGRKGSESWYPDDVIVTIHRIRDEQKSGLTLRQITEKWQSEKVKWAVDVFATLAGTYPDYDIVHGEISEIKNESDDTVVVELKLRKVKRR